MPLAFQDKFSIGAGVIESQVTDKEITGLNDLVEINPGSLGFLKGELEN